VDDAALTELIDAAMAKVRGEPWAQSLTDPDNQVAQTGPDNLVRYYGAAREVGYPGTPCAVLEANLGEETITLVSGDAADYDTEAGRLSVAAHIAGHRNAKRPSAVQVRALAQAVADAEDRDGGGEFELDACEVRAVLDDAG
jgi:hypothetical protein